MATDIFKIVQIKIEMFPAKIYIDIAYTNTCERVLVQKS